MERRLKRGDVREDGLVFRCYGKDYQNGEYWVTPEKFEEYCAKERKYKARCYQSEEYRATLRECGARYRLTEKGRATRGECGARYYATPEGKAARAVRDSARRAAKLAGQHKPSRSFELLGTDLETFKAYMEAQFLPGMTWENHGLWECDHIVPLASGKTPEEIWKLCHYTNLQPLWAEDNRRKGAKLTTC
jgi:hypothetical protein